MRKTVLCYGDSNTYGYNPLDGSRYPKNIRWPGVLQELLGDDYEVIEAGCNGRTTVFKRPDEPWTWGIDHITTAIYTHHPIHILVIMLGSNDLKTEFGASAKDIAEGAAQIVTLAREFCTKKQGFLPEILLVSPPKIGPEICHSPFCDSFDSSAVERSRQLAGEFRKAAESLHCLFADAAEAADPSEADSLHLMPEAHAALAQLICRTITG